MEAPRIYTSYFARLKALDAAGIKPISISLYPPKFFTGPELKALAPTKQMLQMGSMEYTHRYNDILNRLDPEQIRGVIRIHAKGAKSVALLCYERPGEFCHRHLAAEWLCEKLGIQITEFDPEADKKKQLSIF